jgi:hypothetical protein
LRVSTTDPDATLMLHKDGSHLGYQTHYVVDGGKSRIILTVLVTPAEVMENQPMLERMYSLIFNSALYRLRCVTMLSSLFAHSPDTAILSYRPVQL